MSTYDDPRGLPVTAASDAAAAAYDETIKSYLCMSPDVGDKLKATLAQDGGMVMANCLKGYFMMLMAMGGLVPKAAKAASAAGEGLAGATDREKLHVAALTRWAGRDLAGAAEVWEEVLLDHPRDILAARLAHFAHFYAGESKRLRDSVNRILPYWDKSVPGFSYLKGMQAFGSEEAGDYAVGEAAAIAAIELDPVDPWATHAYAHVMEMQDRQDDGLKWIDRLRPHWTKAHNFQNHIWWHEALMMLAQDRKDDVLAQFDAHVFDPDSDEYLDHTNAVSLLQRLEIWGVDVGGRWQAIADKVRDRTEEHLLTFVDLHFTIALAAVGDPKAAEMREFTAAYEGAEDDSNLPIQKAIGVPMMDGLIAYRERRHADAVASILPVRYDIWMMGGSHAQRDLFSLILIDAARKAGDDRLFAALIAERRAAAPDDAWVKTAFQQPRGIYRSLGW
ncbi:MAG: tetratricopeptide repeat protein [Rhodospirillaceae bacterium]